MRSAFTAALLATAFVLPPGQARAAEPRTLATEKHRVQVERIAHVEHPWGLALLPDGRFLVTERNAGTLRIGSRDGTLSAPLAGTPKVFRHGAMFPRWQGHFLTGGLAARALLRTSVENGKVVEDEWMLRDLDRRIRDVAVARDGSVRVLTEHEDGEILRISAVRE